MLVLLCTRGFGKMQEYDALKQGSVKTERHQAYRSCGKAW